LNGDLPPGLSFSTTNGQITGTPTVAGQFGGLSVTATDANGYVVQTAAFAINVADPLVISGIPPRGVAGSGYTFTFGAAGGQQPYSFSLAQGSLPFGLALSSSGTISGTPFVAGTTTNLVVRVTDANGTARDTAPFSITLADQLTIASGPTGSATTGTGYSSAFAAAGGTAPYSFALVSGSLPPGLSLATSGAISGTPTAAGSYGPFSVRVVDADGTIATADATIVVSSPLTIAGAAPGGMVGADYTTTFTAAGGSAPYAYDVAAGTLPDGLSLEAATGLISGKPTKAGTFSGIVVRATDAAGRTAQTTASIAIAAPLRIAGTPTDVGTVGQSYSASFGASGGTGPYAFSLASGTLPAGLSLSPTSGTVSGKPTVAGLAEGLTVKVTDAAGRTAVSDAFRIAVTEVLAVAGSASTSAIAGQAYSAQFSASGGTGPYAWTLASGTLPPGLSLDAASGQISGSPTTLGSYPGLQVRATDVASRTALSAIFGISVSSSLDIAGNPARFATVGQPYTAAFTASGGVGARTFSLATGQLPAGLTFDPATGLISGTPTAKGMSPAIAVRVRDASNSAATAPAFDLYVSDPLVVSGIPGADATVGSAYSGNATVAGGRAAYSWTLDAGTLPPGLQLSPVTGVIAGTPTQAGTASGLRLRVTDVDGRTGTTQLFSITVATALAVTGQTGPGTVGSAYSAQFTASGGLGPYVYQIVGAALPAGLSLDASSGLIAGTTTTAAAGGTMQIRATDAKGRTVSTASFTIDVRDPLRLVPSNIGPGTVGQAYSAAMTPAGGRGPFVLTVAEGSLPPGLVIERTTGAIGGTPIQAGSYPGIVIAAVDADGRTARSEAFGIEVAVGLAVAGVPPQPATVGVPYSFAFTASGGQAPYAWIVAGGSLPPGLGIDGSSGALGGTPTRAGSVTGLSAVVADRARRTGASQPFTIDVRDPVSVSGDPARVAILGQSYAANFNATGGRGPYVFAMVGKLPAGLTLSTSTGAISGTPAIAGDTTDLRVRATDADGRTATSDAFSIATSAPLVVFGTSPAYGDVGVAYSAAFTASGGTSPYVFSLSAGALPAGLSLDATTGRIAGTPTAAGMSSGLQVAVVDAIGTRVASQVFAIAVADPLAATADVARGTVGTTYAARIVVSGGRAAYAYVLASGTLPAGLSLDLATGRIAGTPGAAGTSGDLQVRVTDADGRIALTPAFRIFVDGPLVLASVPAQAATVGVAYDSTAAAMGGRAPYAYALATGTLPAGLTLDPDTGRITGAPTSIGATEGLSISVSDVDGRTATSRVFRIDVRGAMTVAGVPASNATVSTTYGPYQFTASGGRSSYTYAAVGALPPGLTLSSAGVLSGVPYTAGTYAGLQVRATDQDGRTGLSTVFSIEVAGPLSVVATLPPNGTVDTAYQGQVSATGGRPDYIYYVAAGSLPPGLDLDPISGVVSGSPSQVGTFGGIQIAAIDADGRTQVTAAYQIVVGAPLALAYSPPPATRGSGFAVFPSVSGGRSPYRFVMASGTLPTGLNLNASSGAISGTPTVVQTATLQVMVIDADNRRNTSAPFTIDVAPALSLSLASTFTIAVGTATTAGGTAAGGTVPYTFSVVGSVPGMTFNTQTGNFEGTPTTAGSYPATIVVTDASGRRVQASTTVTASAPLVIKPPAVLYVDYQRAYTGAFTATGGSPGYTFALTAGALPYGLTLSSNGQMGGTATRYDNSFFTVTVTDKAGLKAKVDVNLVVSDGIKLDTGRPQDPELEQPLALRAPVGNGLPSTAWAGQFYGGQLSIRNAIGAVGVNVSPPLPDGLAAKVVGDQLFITGTSPVPVAQVQRTVVATDSTGRSSQPFYWSLTVVPMAPAGWAKSSNTYPFTNTYGDLKIWRGAAGERDFAMSKDGRVVAYSAVGKSIGDGNVTLQVDKGTWVETNNNGFAKTAVVPAPVDARAFGTKVVLSRDGTYMAVSAPGLPRTDNSPYYAGSIYVYRRSGDTWEQFSRVDTKSYPGQQTLAMSDDGMRIAYFYKDPYFYTPTSQYESLRDRVSIRVWNGSAYVEEYSIACANTGSNTNVQCGIGQTDLKFSPDGSTLGVVGNFETAIFKKVGAAWQNQYTTPYQLNGNKSQRRTTSVALNTDGTKMLMGTTLTYMNSQGYATAYGWAVVAYVWDGRFWTQVGSNYGQAAAYGACQVYNYCNIASIAPYISASDDLTSFVRVLPWEMNPYVHTWDGRGNPDTGFYLGDANLTTHKVAMSGDGNTIYLDRVVAKASWPSSR
jgi:hypothetical protein